MFETFKVCKKCKKKALRILGGRCESCGYEEFFNPIIMEKVKPIDISGSFSSPAWNEKSGHAEFEYDYDFDYKNWFKDENLKYFSGK